MIEGVCCKWSHKADRGPLVTRRVAPVDYQLKMIELLIYTFLSVPSINQIHQFGWECGKYYTIWLYLNTLTFVICKIWLFFHMKASALKIFNLEIAITCFIKKFSLIFLLFTFVLMTDMNDHWNTEIMLRLFSLKFLVATLRPQKATE